MLLLHHAELCPASCNLYQEHVVKQPSTQLSSYKPGKLSEFVITESVIIAVIYMYIHMYTTIYIYIYMYLRSNSPCLVALSFCPQGVLL